MGTSQARLLLQFPFPRSPGPYQDARACLLQGIGSIQQARVSRGAGRQAPNKLLGLPQWLSWARICLKCVRPGFNPWVGKIRWRRERLPTPVFWPGESHGLYSPWGHKESDRLSNFHFSDSIINSPSPRLLPVDPGPKPRNAVLSLRSGLPQPLTDACSSSKFKDRCRFLNSLHSNRPLKSLIFKKCSSLSFLLLNFKHLSLPTVSMTYEPPILRGL